MLGKAFTCQFDRVFTHASVDGIHNLHELISLACGLYSGHICGKQVVDLSLTLGPNVQQHDACFLVVVSGPVDVFQSPDDVFDQNPRVISCCDV